MEKFEINELEEKFEGSHIIIDLDMPVSILEERTFYSEKIFNEELIKIIIDFAYRNGKYLQDLFEDNQCSYLSCFNDPSDDEWSIITEVLKEFHPLLYEKWISQKEKINNITINFPV